MDEHARRDQAKIAADQRRESVRKHQERHRVPETEFVNPYTFVPLPTSVTRGEPNGHATMPRGSVSGRFPWQLPLESPLLVGDGELPISGGFVSYPGSSLRGTLRSMHESLAGGCMRVLDEDYVPVHREPMNAYDPQADRLAVVDAVDPITGRVTRVRLSAQVVWADITQVHRAIDRQDLRSGARVTVADFNSVEGPNRLNLSRESSLVSSPNGDWYIHLTDSNSARAWVGKKKDKKPRQYFAAMGQIPADADAVDVSEEAWAAFVETSSGSKDRIGDTPPPWPNVLHESASPRMIGRRRVADGTLDVGDTVWLTGDGRLKLSVIWRRKGDFPVGQRIPSVQACKEPDQLCPSCSIFGSIEAESGGDAEQHSYASHVRVSWASANVTEAELAEVPLPPLRNPKPSSGGFYLQSRPNDPITASKDESHIRRSDWGAAADKKGPRLIRGRKYYWHGQTSDGFMRQTPRGHNTNQHGTGRLIPAGTTITATVTFDNLTLPQVGWLLASADPNLILGNDSGSLRIHLGGGKPLGFGTTRPTVFDLQIATAHNRYCGGTDHAPTVARAIAAARRQVPERGLEQVHDAMTVVLDRGAVPANRIAYPTVVAFNEQRSKPEIFDESFRWFSTHSGGRFGELTPLPDVNDEKQGLPTQEER